MNVKRVCFVCVGILSLVLAFMAAAENVKVVVNEAQGRSGPGSFYKLTVLVPEGSTFDVIEKKKSWYKVEYSKIVSWISENSLSARAEKEKIDPLKSFSMDKVSVKASPATLTAAIKGFWTRYSRTDKRKLAELPVDGYDVPVAEYEVFAENRSKSVSQEKLQKKYKLSRKYKKKRISYQKEHSIGYTIASSIAEGSLLENELPVNYVHHVGWYLAESTERYDIKFKYYILDTDHINAVSCPGGFIVLTRGLLELLSDEAELAALLAHEMAHIIAGHAMQSMEEDKTRITADSAFEFLNKETESRNTELEEELVAITNRAISIAKSPKLDEQEFEADRMALRYMARCGYDLNGISRLLSIMMNKHESNIDIFDLNYRNHPDFKERIKRLEKELKKYKKYEGRDFSGSFNENMAF